LRPSTGPSGLASICQDGHASTHRQRKPQSSRCRKQDQGGHV